MGVEENGSGDLGMSGIPLGSKNKYRRMDFELNDYSDDNLEVVPYKQTQQERSASTRKYVFACVVFASLNNVLLGYVFVLRFMILLYQFWFQSFMEDMPVIVVRSEPKRRYVYADLSLFLILIAIEGESKRSYCGMVFNLIRWTHSWHVSRNCIIRTTTRGCN